MQGRAYTGDRTFVGGVHPHARQLVWRIAHWSKHAALCHTDIKKIEYICSAARRVYSATETDGVIRPRPRQFGHGRRGDSNVGDPRPPTSSSSNIFRGLECFYAAHKLSPRKDLATKRSAAHPPTPAPTEMRCGGLRILSVRPGNGLDRFTRRGKNTGAFPSTALLCRTGNTCLKGRHPIEPASHDEDVV